jgi:hypothetical protein
MSVANSDFLILSANLSLLVYLVLLVGVGLWEIRGRLPTVIKAKYSGHVRYMSQLPFAYRWRQAVSTEDLPVFEMARFRHLVFFIALSALPLLISIYYYVHVVIQLNMCISLNSFGPATGK